MEPASETAVLNELRRWIAGTWDPQMTVREWWTALAAGGWSRPAWPEGLGGRGVNAALERAIGKELLAAGTLGQPTGIGLSMGAPTLLRYGSRKQQDRLIPPLVRGETEWCQLFSEPEAGSDLASLRTKATIDGDRWVIHGQKVWTSRAHEADWGMLLVRSNARLRDHRGISFILIAMDQPEIDVRPLRQMNGEAEFNEVFIESAEARGENLIGDRDGGWSVAQTVLGHERSAARQREAIRPGGRGGFLDLPIGVAQERARNDPENARAFGRSGLAMTRLARQLGVPLSPSLRDRVVQLHIRSEVWKYTAKRVEAARTAGRPPGPESSVGKLALSQIAHRARDLAFEVMGAAGMLYERDAPLHGEVHRMCLSAHKVSIGGGTDEIQRNIVAERALGLPGAEPRGSRAETVSSDRSATPADRSLSHDAAQGSTGGARGVHR